MCWLLNQLCVGILKYGFVRHKQIKHMVYYNISVISIKKENRQSKIENKK